MQIDPHEPFLAAAANDPFELRDLLVQWDEQSAARISWLNEVMGQTLPLDLPSLQPVWEWLLAWRHGDREEARGQERSIWWTGPTDDPGHLLVIGVEAVVQFNYRTLWARHPKLVHSVDIDTKKRLRTQGHHHVGLDLIPVTEHTLTCVGVSDPVRRYKYLMSRDFVSPDLLAHAAESAEFMIADREVELSTEPPAARTLLDSLVVEDSDFDHFSVEIQIEEGWAKLEPDRVERLVAVLRELRGVHEVDHYDVDTLRINTDLSAEQLRAALAATRSI
ncbi:hypothetical protein QE364_003989 [Nocardioides zeae]|uniref:Uncharacterized protein n=1 Tax=Nocardioides zeae TaxID=1457234 RepID=A0ACC6INE3_9ACTN|nr:hypothetical protein [Nocardioides zeae]MDR6173389.1 hypothetical protein [Nocardioides zeae]MDR6212254.1 hypothetical protein [Nocardioides zeae]